MDLLLPTLRLCLSLNASDLAHCRLLYLQCLQSPLHWRARQSAHDQLTTAFSRATRFPRFHSLLQHPFDELSQWATTAPRSPLYARLLHDTGVFGAAETIDTALTRVLVFLWPHLLPPDLTASVASDMLYDSHRARLLDSPLPLAVDEPPAPVPEEVAVVAQPVEPYGPIPTRIQTRSARKKEVSRIGHAVIPENTVAVLKAPGKRKPAKRGKQAKAKNAAEPPLRV